MSKKSISIKDIAKLAEQNFTVNVDNLTQDMLDEIAVTIPFYQKICSNISI